MIKKLLNLAQNFSSKIIQSNCDPIKTKLILNLRSKFPNLPLSLSSVQKYEGGGKRLDKFIVFSFTFFSSFLTYMMLKNQNVNGTAEVPEDVLESIVDTSIMAYLDILKDKNFYDYLLQSLTDHYGFNTMRPEFYQLLGYENVTMRPEFTKEFFASYWMYLMKNVGYDNVTPVTLEDHQHHGRITNGFDTIVRSLFGVCESRIGLRVKTLFAFSGKELDDEKEIHFRTAFMLVLLFVSEWIADQKDECSHVALKEPKSRLVHACFNKLFKDIYHGNNECFKAYIFDE
uniref:Uncharacterized protein n=1 Tax=Panagrolaimus sp. PS1159 TaxID=55785 RepID=A0AC35FGD6_9BILA